MPIQCCGYDFGMSKFRFAANGIVARHRNFATRTKRPARTLLTFVSAALLAGCVAYWPNAVSSADEGETAGIVVAAHPLAVDAGNVVLQRGGTAMDAAVAVQMMLGLVEPQSSGIGGGAIIMAYDARSRAVSTYLGREAAPADATPALFNGPDGRPLTRAQAMLSGRATGVPAAIEVFSQAQQDHGALPWDRLFDETIEQAEVGFEVTPRLARHIHGRFPQASAPDVRRFFARADGSPMQIGDRVRNPAYADTLRRIAAGNTQAFYRGELAEAIIARASEPPLAGSLSTDDLAAYRAGQPEPLCLPLRQYTVCVPPPPASGVGLLQLMALLDRTDIDQRGPDDPQAWFLFAEASRLMYADRDQYVADPEFRAVPVGGLLDPAYVDRRRALIGDVAGELPLPGVPEGSVLTGPDATAEPGGTSHFVVVDRWGNAVSVTTTIESFFGSGRMVEGFFLNNQLTDFSWAAADGPSPANGVEAGKRPRSSMTPVLLLDAQGRFVGAIGSPGGSAIPAYIAKTLVGAIYWDLPLADAVALPNLVARGARFDGESSRFNPVVLQELAQRGMVVRPGSGEDSGLHGVLYRDGVLEWAADPRREGTGRHATNQPHP